MELEKQVSENSEQLVLIFSIFSLSKGHIIYDQIRKLGAGADWDRAVFMMDPVFTFFKIPLNH